ncbi:aminotransferase class IV family protein [Shimia aestuarii]|uniref:Probable branched-chain-amino-acid aminotransferase n=1 Tax=Shimia aestuarii TaxID=254406 RepID=A0A1I4R447_9RHOB|nr:aminotransferase class IV family protein [Shimia aestuarii]SFM47039.1 4-amino-4-deoxychorismate lyase [Shimia aestuarii]
MESPFRAPVPDGTRLIETFCFDPSTRSITRRDLHKARLERSAAAFGFPLDHAEIRAKLDAFDCDAPLRCRLTLDREGRVEIVAAPMPPATAREWVVTVSGQRLRSDDPWLAHKTTQRALYDETRATLPKGVDEVLFLNERDELCEGTITNLFVTLETGEMVTPPLSCGVLPGVLRQSLIEAGEVREAVVTLPMLGRARALHVGNSLRGLIPARLAG